jgi:hypothetical protein
MLKSDSWTKSSASAANGDCVELKHRSAVGVVAVRDSKDPDGPRLEFPSGAMANFLAAVNAGDFGDIPA